MMKEVRFRRFTNFERELKVVLVNGYYPGACSKTFGSMAYTQNFQSGGGAHQPNKYWMQQARTDYNKQK
jgi:outer membrane protease